MRVDEDNFASEVELKEQTQASTCKPVFCGAWNNMEGIWCRRVINAAAGAKPQSINEDQSMLII